MLSLERMLPLPQHHFKSCARNTPPRLLRRASRLPLPPESARAPAAALAAARSARARAAAAVRSARTPRAPAPPKLARSAQARNCSARTARAPAPQARTPREPPPPNSPPPKPEPPNSPPPKPEPNSPPPPPPPPPPGTASPRRRASTRRACSCTRRPDGCRVSPRGDLRGRRGPNVRHVQVAVAQEPGRRAARRRPEAHVRGPDEEPDALLRGVLLRPGVARRGKRRRTPPQRHYPSSPKAFVVELEHGPAVEPVWKSNLRRPKPVVDFHTA